MQSVPREDVPAVGASATAELGGSLVAAIEARLAQVGSSLNLATGGGALCRIEGIGGGAKRLEGRMAALLEARRALRTDPGADLAALALRWHSEAQSRQARGSAPAWLDYLEGGAGELDALLIGAPTTQVADARDRDDCT